MDPDGKVLWKKNYGIMTTVDYGVDVDALADGGYVIVGNIEDPENGLNVLIIRTDADGNVTWRHELGNVDDDSAVAVRELPDGYIMLLGQEDSKGIHSANATLAHLTKFNANGDLVSDEEYKGVTGSSMAVTPDGGVVVAGTKSKQIYAFKADKNGKMVSEMAFNPTNAGVSEEGVDISPASDGGYIIAGSQTSDSSKKAIMIKADANLKEQWSKTYGKASGYYDMNNLAKAAVRMQDGGYAILIHTYTGNMQAIPHAQVIKTDARGNAQWTKDFPEDFGRDGESDLVVLKDGSLAVAGTERYLSNPEYPYDQNVFVADLGTTASGGIQNIDDPGDLTGTVHAGNYVLILLGAGACLSALVILLIVGLLYMLFRKKK
jgi:hypothetical protein